MSPLASPEKMLDLNFKQGSIFDQLFWEQLRCCKDVYHVQFTKAPREHLVCTEIRASIHAENVVKKWYRQAGSSWSTLLSPDLKRRLTLSKAHCHRNLEELKFLCACVHTCTCVLYLSTALSKRVLPVCQPNGQKLGQSELFNSFLGGEKTLPASSLGKEARTPFLWCTLMTHTAQAMPSVQFGAAGPKILK